MWAPPPGPAPRTCSPSSLALYAVEGTLLAMYVVALWKNGWEIDPLYANPCIGASRTTLARLGLVTTPALVRDGEWWRLVAAAFLSAGAIDLLATTALVASLGGLLGRSALAPALTVPLIFIASSVAGGLVSANLAVRAPAVGAPAGGAGLVGAALLYQAREGGRGG